MFDPWIEGFAFDNGWSLLSDSKFTYENFSSITHIWFSHEHPDHFSPYVLKKIDPKIRGKITIFYQKTKDKKVISFCKNLGFKEIIELDPDKYYHLNEDFILKCQPFTEGDSWLYLNINKIGILNLNDCVIGTKESCENIKSKIENVDLLLTQFSYAHKVGEADDTDKRINKINEKIERIKNQCLIFNPSYIIPFASFVYFCHEENFYMNPPFFPLRKVHDYITEKLHKQCITMYPGESWEYKSVFNSTDTLTRYENDFNLIQNPITFSKKYDTKSLIDESKKYGEKILKKNPTASRLLNKLGVRFYIKDYNKSYILYANKGLIEKSISRNNCDVLISSEALAYIFKYEWGAATYHVNARYQYPKNGDSYRFDLLIHIGILNNEGLEYVWNKPTLLKRVLHRIKK
jgi:UDP-MurNAc hydroxylase